LYFLGREPFGICSIFDVGGTSRDSSAPAAGAQTHAIAFLWTLS